MEKSVTPRSRPEQRAMIWISVPLSATAMARGNALPVAQPLNMMQPAPPPSQPQHQRQHFHVRDMEGENPMPVQPCCPAQMSPMSLHGPPPSASGCQGPCTNNYHHHLVMRDQCVADSYSSHSISNHFIRAAAQIPALATANHCDPFTEHVEL